MLVFLLIMKILPEELYNELITFDKSLINSFFSNTGFYFMCTELCLHVCSPTICAPGVSGGQETALAPLAVEL